MKNNIINELRFASKKKKNAVLGYIYCDYLLDMFEEIESLNVEIKELNYLLLKHYEKPYAKKWLEEQRENYKKEHPDTDTELGYPDSETIYKEYYKLINIIKEVREYIEENTEEKKSWLYGIPDYEVFKGDTKELLEILDKGE